MMAGNKLFYKKKKSMALLLIDLGISIFSNGNFPENLVVKIMAQSSLLVHSTQSSCTREAIRGYRIIEYRTAWDSPRPGRL